MSFQCSGTTIIYWSGLNANLCHASYIISNGDDRLSRLIRKQKPRETKVLGV